MPIIRIRARAAFPTSPKKAFDLLNVKRDQRPSDLHSSRQSLSKSRAWLHSFRHRKTLHELAWLFHAGCKLAYFWSEWNPDSRKSGPQFWQLSHALQVETFNPLTVFLVGWLSSSNNKHMATHDQGTSKAGLRHRQPAHRAAPTLYRDVRIRPCGSVIAHTSDAKSPKESGNSPRNAEGFQQLLYEFPIWAGSCGGSVGGAEAC